MEFTNGTRVSISTNGLAIYAVDVCSDGQIAFGTSNGQVGLWNPATQKSREIGIHSAPVIRIAARRNGDIATLEQGVKTKVAIWKSTTCSAERLSVKLSYAHDLIKSESDDVFVFARTGKDECGCLIRWMPNFEQVIVRRTGQLLGSQIALTKDGRCCYYDSCLRLWDPRSGEISTIGSPRGSVTSLCVIGDDTIVTGDDEGFVEAWTSRGGAPESMYQHSERRGDYEYSDWQVVLCALNAQEVISGGSSGRLYVWKPGNDPQLIETPDRINANSIVALSRNSFAVSSVRGEAWICSL